MAECGDRDGIHRVVSRQSTGRRRNLHEERFFVGLRLAEGVAPTTEEWQRYEQPLSHFLREGLLEKHGSAVRLTDRGVLLSNEVFQEFLGK